MTFARAVTNDENAFAFAVHTGIININNPPNCECGLQKRVFIRGNRERSLLEGLIWECPKVQNRPYCGRKLSVQSVSFFQGTKLPILKILELMISWFFEVPVTSAAGQLGVSKKTAIMWYQYCREVCFNVIAEQDICIGGPGLHVEIDESHLWSPKYHRGRPLAHGDIWVFGGICRESKEAFVTLVPDRSGPTLWPIIKQKIAQGTIIMTDSARVYQNLHLPNRGGFEHYMVNHSQEFVVPYDPNIHTNTIERHWGLLKKKIHGYTTDHTKIEYYLTEFLYRRQFLSASTDVERRRMGSKFRIFLQHVSQQFP